MSNYLRRRRRDEKRDKGKSLRAIEARIGERRGRPSEEFPQKFAEIPEGVETRDYAAQRAGFGNAETARGLA